MWHLPVSPEQWQEWPGWIFLHLFPSTGQISYQHMASPSTSAAVASGVKLGSFTPSSLALVGLNQTLIKMGEFFNLIKNIESINETLKWLHKVNCEEFDTAAPALAKSWLDEDSQPSNRLR